MPGLLYKNLRINFYSFIVMIVTSIICSIAAVVISIVVRNSSDIDAMVMVIMISYYSAFLMPSMLSSYLFEADEGRAASSFAMSLPQGARGHVESKYWFILIQNLIVLLITITANAITYVILGGRFSATFVIVLFFSWRLLISAIEIPFVIRFGSQKGMAIKGLTVTCVLFLGLVYFLFGDISWLTGSSDPLSALLDFVSSGKIMVPLLLFPFICLAAYRLSCLISVKVFRKGAENYEQ